MDRLAILSIDEVLSKIGTAHKACFRGFKVKVNTTRLQLFKFKGIDCVSCGLKGAYFAIEQYDDHVSPHLNLYSSNNILMTKDHIIPKSKGGGDFLDNLQTLCTNCNNEKGNRYDYT